MQSLRASASRASSDKGEPRANLTAALPEARCCAPHVLERTQQNTPLLSRPPLMHRGQTHARVSMAPTTGTSRTIIAGLME